jgi:uncharacterized repeat protein (TIGR03833 family)
LAVSHQIQADLGDLRALGGAVKELQWYTEQGGYQLAGVTVEGGRAVWVLEVRPAAPEPAARHAVARVESRRTVEPGDEVVIQTKAEQMAQRLRGAATEGVTGTVFRVLTRGPHPHGMKVELRDRTVGRVQRNVTAPGAGEPTGRRQ